MQFSTSKAEWLLGYKSQKVVYNRYCDKQGFMSVSADWLASLLENELHYLKPISWMSKNAMYLYK